METRIIELLAEIRDELREMNQKTDNSIRMAEQQHGEAKKQMQETMAMYAPLLQGIINSTPRG